MSYDKLCLYRHQSDQGKALKIIGLIENGLMEWNTITSSTTAACCPTMGREVQRSVICLEGIIYAMKTGKQCVVLEECNHAVGGQGGREGGREGERERKRERERERGGGGEREKERRVR